MARYTLVSQTSYSPSGADQDVDLAALTNALIPENQAAASAILTILNDGPDPVVYLLSAAGTTAANTFAASPDPHIFSDVALPFQNQILRVPDGTTCYLDIEVSV